MNTIDSTEARTLDQQQVLGNVAESIEDDMNLIFQQKKQPSQKSNLDMDIEEDEEDNLQTQQNFAMASTGTNLVYNQPIAEQSKKSYKSIPSADLKTSASHHHHGLVHGAKGWLKMGAWTGKKGAFGWHGKHPAGKGK